LNTRYQTERDLQDLHEPVEQDREISLGATTILGIFFALALICAVFFGFGYSLGRKSAQPVAASVEATPGLDTNSGKPAPGSPAEPIQGTSSEKPTAANTQSAVVPLDPANASSKDDQQMTGPGPQTSIKAPAPAPRSIAGARTAVKPLAVTPVSAALPSPGASVVQVAAMSHQEDAVVVAQDLKRRGYAVAIRHVPQDKLFHVQIGPFANKRESDAMRQRLQADGYNNAIVK
jgi:DedD protein